ncbi:hypothetical protein [Comamonas sp. CMM02]|uniref:hypothetical protein n=1 Tax=Comamonas sp. CMM02 TaxID=2769307 RepID=UPI001780D3BF|nr:hypothetical protein [Comamonas sp. CMM02]MBD9400833.1 hypothetical protein [Comamonas sp. CMM02]
MSGHEEGLISQYVSKIQHLAVRAEEGKDVTSEVENTVKEAVNHFRIVQSSDPYANLLAFKGRLSIFASVVHPSQPAYRRTLEHAANACPSDIK